MFWNNSTGIQLWSSSWIPDQPQAIIILIHGQGEHIGRYAHVARWMNQHGIGLTGYDQQGFGKSGGPRGHASSLDAYLRDIGAYIDQIKAQYPTTPLFLYGHSMGGNVCLNYLLRYKPTVLSGAIITGPWIQLAFEAPKIKVIAGRLLRSIWPTLALPSGLDTRLISTDPAVVTAYNNDPLVHDKVSAAAGIALIDGAAWLNQYSGLVPCPLLLMHGGADGITSAPATKAFSRRIEGNITHVEWPGMYHEIHNEPDQEKIFETTKTWLKARF